MPSYSLAVHSSAAGLFTNRRETSILIHSDINRDCLKHMPEPRIIAIETSGRSGSVAIAEGPRLIQEAEFAADQEHARDLLPLIDSLFQVHEWTPASVEQCHVSIGPGSFTGLRVAVTFARHFALATGAKICAVPTLDVIAMNALKIQPPPEAIGRHFGCEAQSGIWFCFSAGGEFLSLSERTRDH
ncbi:MAG: tRNA (adenosine(37)-N6)-threonylcarbamoyltransferase complex dimerization subunit type 1 TsaB [Planctomycetes bacterium]|nr:tRNA (adenosine(37)-N6)-threonylcarbamoyltransferase complex dimerization subunit type 1 TsaB [Planctomycetota bacterium]